MAETFGERVGRFVEALKEAGARNQHTPWNDAREIPGRAYWKVDVAYGRPGRDVGQWSGKYMVEVATGQIYGIKGYGKVHKGHQYGTLDTLSEWNWIEGIKPVRFAEKQPKVVDNVLTLHRPERTGETVVRSLVIRKRADAELRPVLPLEEMLERMTVNRGEAVDTATDLEMDFKGGW